MPSSNQNRLFQRQSFLLLGIFKNQAKMPAQPSKKACIPSLRLVNFIQTSESVQSRGWLRLNFKRQAPGIQPSETVETPREQVDIILASQANQPATRGAKIAEVG